MNTFTDMRLFLTKQMVTQSANFIATRARPVKATYVSTQTLQTSIRRMKRLAQKLHDTGMNRDTNFIALLDALDKTCTFIAERDNHYRTMLHIFLLMLYHDVQDRYADFAKDPDVMEPKTANALRVADLQV